MKVILTPEQEELLTIIKENLAIAKRWNENVERQLMDTAFENMKTTAHQLHMQLIPQPKHKRHMIENRNLQPDDPEFYNHIHPVEDLIDYLNDMSANDDPIDHTLDKKFDFKIYTSRWGHYDVYKLTRNKDGWYLEAQTYTGQDDHYCSKWLKGALDHDSVSYPRNYGSFLYSIWYRAQDEGLAYEPVKQMLDELAEWISQTEKTAPRHFEI